MTKRKGMRRILSAILLVSGVVGAWAANVPSASAQQATSTEKKSSWSDSISSGFKSVFSGKSNQNSSRADAPLSKDDPVSLQNSAKPGPELHVAMARMHIQAGSLADAEQQYQAALRLKPDHLSALLGYAQLKEQQGHPDEAIRLYQRAAKAYPRQASVYNNAGLCYARQDQLQGAVLALTRATELEPKNPLYRNNIAAVLVEQDRLRDAFGHLKAVHNDATAYYNLGYLLYRKGQPQAAAQYFALALNADPSMAPAQRWVEYLQRTNAQTRLTGHPSAGGVRVVSPPSPVENTAAEAPAPPKNPPREDPEPKSSSQAEAPMPQRLPPTERPPEQLAERPRLPGISYDRPSVPAAPLPPESSDDIEPLPRVE